MIDEDCVIHSPHTTFGNGFVSGTGNDYQMNHNLGLKTFTGESKGVNYSMKTGLGSN